MLSLVVATCLQLSGQWVGDCEYKSATYGNLSGEIAFNIQQDNCEKIKIDNADLNIPGQFESIEEVDSETQKTVLHVRWPESSEDPQSLKEKLFYQYNYTATKRGVVIDEVALDGFFYRSGQKLNLFQKGQVDSDQVEISCSMRKKL